MRKAENSDFSIKKYSVSLLLGTGTGFLACVLLLFVFSAIVLSGAISENSTFAVVVAALFLGAASGGFIAIKKHKTSPLPVGFGIGLCIFVLCCIVGLIFYDSFIPSEGGVIRLLSSVFGGFVGALLGKRRKKRRK